MASHRTCVRRTPLCLRAAVAVLLAASPCSATASVPTRKTASVATASVATPIRGWNSWFAFDTHLNETVLASNADALVSTGLAALGYSLVALDGGWQGGRFQNGTVYENATAFPHGLLALSDYIHARGLQFGAYTDRGAKTCDNHVGSAGFEAQDAAFYASIKADLVKEDSCDATQSHAGALAQFALMQSALAATGRPIALSLCGWLKWYAGGAGGAGIGVSWRTGPDALSWPNVLMNIDAAADAAPFTAPGRFVDVDEIMGPSRGRPINAVRTATQLAFIAVVGSPLLLSFDLTGRNASDPDVAPFLNTELLAVHGDASPSGPRFARVAGGSLAPDRITPLTRLPCEPAAPRVQWDFVPRTPGGTTGSFAARGAPGMCLMAGAAWSFECQNAQQVWLGACGDASGHGPNCCPSPLSPSWNCSNQLLTLAEDGTIVTPYWPANNNAPGPFLTLDSPTPNSLFFEERLNGTDAVRQAWRWDAATGTLASGSDGTCLGADPRDVTNVWARALEGGAIAMLFVNIDTVARNITCDAACWAGSGAVASSRSNVSTRLGGATRNTTMFTVRDLITHTDNGTVDATQSWGVTVAPGGGSVFVRLTPVSASAVGPGGASSGSSRKERQRL